MTLESNELTSDILRIGAEQAAAGRTLGLSPEETFNLQQYLKEQGIRGVRPDINAPDPFGEAPEQAYDDRGMPVGEARRPQDDFRPADAKPGRNSGRNILVREEKVRGGGLPEEFLTANEVAEGMEGRGREVDGGRRAVADALGLVKMAEDKYGVEAFGSDGPKIARLIERLEEDANPGPVENRRGRESAANMIQNDRRALNASEIDKAVATELENRFGGEFGWNQPVRAMPIDARVKAETEIRAGLEGRGGKKPLVEAVNADAASRRAERQGREGDQRGQRILDELDEIRSLGAVKDRGPSGQVEFARPNDPTTAQALNAPTQGPLPRDQRWMVDHLPDYGREGGDSFGYPQVGVLEEGKLFADRLRAGGLNVPRAEVRNLAELQQAADFVVSQAAAQGQRLGRYDQAAGGIVYTDNPGIQEVLYKLKYSDNEIQRLANAMNQVEMQRIAGGPNAAKAEMFAERVPIEAGPGVEVLGNNPNMRPDGGTPLELIKNEKVGRGKEKKGVGAALRGIGPEDVVRQLEAAGQLYTEDASGQRVMLPEAANAIAGADAARSDAQMAVIGGIKGEVPKAAYVRGDVRQMGRPERVRRFGKENADAAGQVEANFLAGEEARRRRAAGQQIVEIRPQRRGGVSDFPDVSRTDAGEGFRNVAVPSSKQSIEPARVAQSMSPDPWAGTGPARMEPAIQGGQQAPQLALPPGRSARPLNTEMKQQLNQLTPERAVNNPPANEYRFSPDYQNPKNRINREVGKRIERENLRRRAGYGTAAAAGIAGLTALLNNGRDEQQQEQEQYS